MNSGRALWGILLVAVAAGLWLGGRDPERPALTAPAALTPVSTASMTVHVGGWVARPGLVELAAGARVADAIAAAGGTLPGAKVASLNLAAILVDGEQVLVSGPDDAELIASEGEATDNLIHLNQATTEELDQLPGIGPVIAQRIVDYRTGNGPFQATEDLLDVPGIGEAKLASIRDLVVP